MAQFDDLSEYRYGGGVEDGVLHVGWLGPGSTLQCGVVPPHLLAKLKRLAATPVELYRGTHVCELCEVPDHVRQAPGDELARYNIWNEWAKGRQSNGEIRVSGKGVIYAAPVLITHYIEEHGYCPPGEFLAAVEEHRESP
jgi:hypothetical protein